MGKILWRLGAFALVFVILAVGVLGVRETRRTQARIERSNCLKQVFLGLYNYDLQYHRLPTAVHRDESGRPLSSWRFHILPHVEATAHDWNDSKAWDDPVNQRLSETPLLVYCFQRNRPMPDRLQTSVFAVTGPGTAFDGDRECRLVDIDSDTILAIEISESGIPWAAPGDRRISDITPSVLHGLDGDGVHVLFADGAIWHLSPDAPFEDLKKLFTIKGAKANDRSQLLGEHAQSVSKTIQ